MNIQNIPDKEQQNETGICSKCKRKLPQGAKWCPECGEPVSPQSIPWYIWLMVIGIALQVIGKLIKAGVI